MEACGLKYNNSEGFKSYGRHALWRRVDWNVETSEAKKFVGGHALWRRVDWNAGDELQTLQKE